MEEIASQILKKMDEHQTNLSGSITYLLQMLVNTVKEVQIAVDYRPQLRVS